MILYNNINYQSTWFPALQRTLKHFNALQEPRDPFKSEKYRDHEEDTLGR